ncbi:Retrovirus-related Pol polyprotein from transposon RE1 [Vitis vinifera]|uniref:Retrovirus-related Pol polyprotein from transposon RE1 n=1 Tax=Vitis vinifera TaxID=29760 RepID=A0A438HTP2_VITVI|nr:Retrovirus-related Pol polyprotein from transposon RE1 [Vitis vinifera]
MTNNPTVLCHVRPYAGQSSIQTANGNSLPIIAIGDASSKFTDVFLASQFSTNLISVGQLVDNNYLSMVWHRRLGHPNTQILSHVLNSDLPGNKDRSSLSLECDSCKLGKSKTLLFPLHASRASHCFDLFHSDCLGTFPDSGGEYLSTEFQAFLASKGIIHQRSCPSTPQQNGVVESKNRHPPRCAVLRSSSSQFSLSTSSAILFQPLLLHCPILIFPHATHMLPNMIVATSYAGEISALEANHTWDIEPCPPTIVSSGLQMGLLSQETFAHVAKMTTVRTISSSCWLPMIGQYIRWMQSKYDTSLFLRKSDMGIVVLLVYVDDIVITGSDSALLGQLKTHLSESFHMKDLGSLTYFLGLEVHHSPYGISLNQHKYAGDLVATAGLQGATSIDTPMELNVKLRKEEDDLVADPSLYRKLDHTYVQGTSTHGLFFPAGNSTRLAAYNDVDWAGCVDTRCSIIDFSETDPTLLHADNTSAIQITTNPVYHERTKHIEVDSHSIREAFEARVITLPHISTDLQIADIFTKALPHHRHCLLSSKLMLVDQPASI